MLYAMSRREARISSRKFLPEILTEILNDRLWMRRKGSSERVVRRKRQKMIVSDRAIPDATLPEVQEPPQPVIASASNTIRTEEVVFSDTCCP
jgi:hypothetical protein